jgi:hypothetical protein
MIGKLLRRLLRDQRIEDLKDQHIRSISAMEINHHHRLEKTKEQVAKVVADLVKTRYRHDRDREIYTVNISFTADLVTGHLDKNLDLIADMVAMKVRDESSKFIEKIADDRLKRHKSAIMTRSEEIDRPDPDPGPAGL